MYEVMVLMRTTMSAKSLCALPVFVLVAGVALADGYPGTIVEPLDAAGDAVVSQPDLGILLAAYGVNDGGDIDRDSDTDVQDLILLLGAYGEGCP